MAIYHLSETVLQLSKDGFMLHAKQISRLPREYDGSLRNTRSQGDGLPNATKKGHFPTESAAKNAFISLYTVHTYIAYIYNHCI